MLDDVVIECAFIILIVFKSPKLVISATSYSFIRRRVVVDFMKMIQNMSEWYSILLY